MFRLFLLALMFSLFSAAPCLAAEESSVETISTKPIGLTPIDWGIIVAYALATLGLGYYYSRKQESTQEYFTGSGHMNWLLIGVSLFATLLSTISYLSMPGESLGKGPGYMASYLALPFVFFAVAYGLLPVYMRHRVTSAYELLEAKLGLSIRMLGATLFIILRLVWMSLLIYLTAKAMSIMMGLTDAEIPLIACITGMITVFYTSMGGLRAVVITDLMQTILLYGGALLVVGTVTYDLGDFSWVPTTWNPNWDKQPIFSTDPSTRVTLVGAMLSYFIWNVCTSGGDQVSVQRFMATKDVHAARRAVLTQFLVTAVVVITLGFVGFALLGYFEAHPERLPAGYSLKADADKLFPHFISYELPVGISGLVVAGMFAAAMSSLDSGVNSITAVVVTDYFDRFGCAPKTERGHVRLSRGMAFGIGTFVVLCSSFMEHVPGNITAVTQKTSNLLTTPIFGLFFFALFVPFASPKGVWIGTICGTLTAVLVGFSGPIVVFLFTQFGINPAHFGASIGVVDPVARKVIGEVDPDTRLVIGKVDGVQGETIGEWKSGKILIKTDPFPKKVLVKIDPKSRTIVGIANPETGKFEDLSDGRTKVILEVRPDTGDLIGRSDPDTNKVVGIFGETAGKPIGEADPRATKVQLEVDPETGQVVTQMPPGARKISLRIEPNTLMIHVEVQPVTKAFSLSTAVPETKAATGETYLDARDPISFQWIAPIAIAVNILLGCLGSLLFPRRQSAAN